MSSRTLMPFLVGEAPSRGSDAARPFSGRSGERLRRLLGSDLEGTFDLRNLLDAWPGVAGKGSRWDAAAARESAARIALEWTDGRLLVLVGHRVARAFSLDGPYLDVAGSCRRSVVFPHPSGVNRWWNDPGNAERARRFLRSLA